jgi:lipooligosaccharide transport system ATP-binding protein
MQQALLTATNVKKSYGDFEAVRDVSFDIKKGECFGLLGPNGAGKSTLIGMIYGNHKRTSGSMTVFGRDPDREAREIKRKIGVVTQQNALDEGLTVRENMELYASFVALPKAQRRQRIRELLEFMNIEHKEEASIRTLSGGMARRLVFVRALLANPDFLILDEPTTGLDPAVRHLIWGKVNQLKAEGKTTLLTTHYIHEAEMLCDRLVIMNKGQMITEGTPKALREKYAPGYVAVFEPFTHSAKLREVAQKMNCNINENTSGIYVRALQFEELLEFQKLCGVNALQLRPSNLEDVFLMLTGHELNIND